MTNLEMFGDLETSKNEKRMVVRVAGYEVGESDGWFHWNGLCVVFPKFITKLNFLATNMPKKVPKKNIHLIVDFYSGQGAIMINDEAVQNGKAHWSFQLVELLAQLKNNSC